MHLPRNIEERGKEEERQGRKTRQSGPMAGSFASRGILT